MATKEFFPGIEKIKFEGKDSKNPMAFRYYDAEKVINGKKMKDWLKFSMAWWHTLCAEGGDQFGGGTLGMVTQTLFKLQKIKWMQVSNSCRKSVSNTTVSTMWIWFLKVQALKNMRPI